LKAAGFVDPAFERTDGPVMIGRDVEQAVEFQLALGPAGEIVREAGELATTRHGEIVAALRDALSQYVASDGSVRMQSSWGTFSESNPA
jgi:hypothetical protein